MDMQSVLEATFTVPTNEPAWQRDLLLQLEQSDMVCTEPKAAKPAPVRLRPRGLGSNIQ